MSELFRKEALQRRSRALYGDVRLSAPIHAVWITLIVLLAINVIGLILFLIPVGTGTVWSWLNG
jgi:hypothetical protein